MIPSRCGPWSKTFPRRWSGSIARDAEGSGVRLAKDVPQRRSIEPKPSANASVLSRSRLGGLHRYTWGEGHRSRSILRTAVAILTRWGGRYAAAVAAGDGKFEVLRTAVSPGESRRTRVRDAAHGHSVWPYVPVLRCRMEFCLPTPAALV
jgi:hypothetical protein